MKTIDTYSLCAHMSRFGTDQACHDYLAQVRWNGKPQCPKCKNNHMNYYISKKNSYKCSKCDREFSNTQGTIFHKSKIPLHKWFLAIYFFTVNKRGVSSIQLGKFLGIKQQSAWYLLVRLRVALKDEGDIILSGIVEADETLIAPNVSRDKRLQAAKYKHDKQQNELHGPSAGVRLRRGEKKKLGRKKGSTKEVLEQKKLERKGRKYRSHVTGRIPFEKGIVVLGMLERNGRIVLKNIGKNRKDVIKEIIHPILQKNIDKNAVFITDEHGVYFNTEDYFKEHLSVNHKKGYCIDGIHSNSIENVWAHIKRTIMGSYFHYSPHHANGYLLESSYRWNRQNDSELTLFEDFIPMSIGKRITYNEVKIRKENKLAA